MQETRGHSLARPSKEEAHNRRRPGSCGGTQENLNYSLSMGYNLVVNNSLCCFDVVLLLRLVVLETRSRGEGNNGSLTVAVIHERTNPPPLPDESVNKLLLSFTCTKRIIWGRTIQVSRPVDHFQLHSAATIPCVGGCII